MKRLSVIVPCYNEEEALPLFYQAMVPVLDQLREQFQVESEMILVDDGSQDNTLSVMRELRNRDARVRYIAFSRNFGKEAALYAGFEHVDGDYITLMDADLQDPPALLPQMLTDLQTGEYDCVATKRSTRKGEPPVRSFFAHCFYHLINRWSKTEIVDGARDFRMMTRQMADAILGLSEYNRFSKGLFGWVGFRTKWLEYENVQRVAGKTKWSFWGLFKYSLEGIFAFSTVPLAFASWLGVILCLIALLAIGVIILKTLIWGDPVTGWPSLACIIVFIGGIQLFCIGILGQYIAKMYLESKRRPIYIARETSEDGALHKEKRG